MEIPADPRGRQAHRRTAWGLFVVATVAITSGLLFGGTKVAGVPVPGWVGAVAGALLAGISVALLRWSRQDNGGLALSTVGDLLVIAAHAGPALRLRRSSIVEVEHVRPTGSATEAVAFGSHVFFVRTSADVSPGVRAVPVGSKYVAADLEHVRDQLLAWCDAAPPPAPHQT